MENTAPVKFFAALLFNDQDVAAQTLPCLETVFGPLDFTSSDTPFDVTDYYTPEMGSPLFRRLVSFYPLKLPDFLVEAKHAGMAIEREFSTSEGKRTVNIDAGYMDFDKVVLASTKKGPYKIYMTKGIWADMTLHYEKGAFLPFSWSFADFKDGRYEKALLRVRELYKKSKSTVR